MLLRKGVNPYEYMDDWEKFNETALPEKEEFYSNLNLGDVTDADYMHEKRVCKDFEIKHLGEYHDLYLKSDTLLLADVFENFRKMCLKIYKLSQFNEDFIKNYNEESDEGYFLEVDVQYPEKLHELHNDLPFYQKERK